MSANAQKSNAKLSEVEDSPKVRLALVRAPLELFSKTHPSKAARIRRDLRDSVGQWFAEARLPYFDYLHVLARVGSDDEDGNLLLRAGMAPDLGTLGLFGKACIHSDTLWTALKTAQRLMDGLVSAGKINIRLQRNRCRVSVSTAPLVADGFDESSKYLISLLCYLVCLSDRTSNADLKIFFPGASCAHLGVFPKVQRFVSASEYALEFDEHLLKSPLKFSNPELNAFLPLIVEELNQLENDADLALLLKKMNAAALNARFRPLRLSEAAYLLDTNARTLQLRLKNRGTTFSDLRNTAVHQKARIELAAGRSINETSDLLGFEHRQSFSEAFHRWEGTAPSVFASLSKC